MLLKNRKKKFDTGLAQVAVAFCDIGLEKVELSTAPHLAGKMDKVERSVNE